MEASASLKPFSKPVIVKLEQNIEDNTFTARASLLWHTPDRAFGYGCIMDFRLVCGNGIKSTIYRRKGVNQSKLETHFQRP